MSKKSLFEEEVSAALDEIGAMLVEKNIAYGDSALNPVRIFSKADPMEQLKVRIDDKLSRILRGGRDSEDVIQDLIGYLVIYKIQHNRLVSSGVLFDPT